jgi:hypothetical protein
MVNTRCAQVPAVSGTLTCLTPLRIGAYGRSCQPMRVRMRAKVLFGLEIRPRAKKYWPIPFRSGRLGWVNPEEIIDSRGDWLV